MWFSGFFFLILSLIVEVYLWWKLQASLIFLSGRTCTIGGWLNTFLPHCIYIYIYIYIYIHSKWSKVTVKAYICENIILFEIYAALLNFYSWKNPKRSITASPRKILPTLNIWMVVFAYLSVYCDKLRACTRRCRMTSPFPVSVLASFARWFWLGDQQFSYKRTYKMNF